MKIKSLCLTVIFFGSLFSLQAAEKADILIAVDSSEFKSELSKEINDLAEAESYTITLRESVKKIRDWELDEFDAVITINRGTAGRMNRKLIKVLEGGNYPPMVIITSYADPGSSKDNYAAYNSVDGITTASLTDSNEIKELAEEIILRIKELLEK